MPSSDLTERSERLIGDLTRQRITSQVNRTETPFAQFAYLVSFREIELVIH